MKSSLCLPAVLLLLAGTTASYAQVHRMERADTSATIRTYNLNPVVVTGTGHHQRAKSATTPVRVLSREEISEQGITTFDAALERMLPQASMAPNSMGSFLRLNGLGNKYVLILINGQKLIGDISNNIDLQRVNMSRVRRIEVLDGAASTLYGSDAIGGVINIITDQPTSSLCSLTGTTKVSGHGVFTEAVNLDIYTKGFGSYTSYTHDRADSYQNNDLVYKSGSDTETQRTLAPLFTGYRSHLLDQRFTVTPTEQLSLNAGIGASFKKTDRPDTRADISGGTDYEMRYRGLRWNVGGIYKLSQRHSLQADFTDDHFRYGREYDVETKTQHVGDYVQSKKQRSLEGEAKGIFHFFGDDGHAQDATTIVGAQWRKDFLNATSGSIDSHVYTLAAYAQHEHRLFRFLTAAAALRYTHHETFGNHLSPKASLMFSAGNVSVRAAYAAGFRAPGLDELHYHYFAVSRGKPQIIFGNRDLKPEKSHYFSLNAEWRSQDVMVSLTGFINNVNDMVVRKDIDVDAAALSRLRTHFPEMSDDQAALLQRYSLYQNSDRGRVKGLNVALSVNVTPELNLTANYALTDAKSKADGRWTTLERSMRHAATAALNWHHAFSRLYALNVNLNSRLQSKTFYPAYEDAPGFALFNLHTTHTFDCARWAYVEPSFGVDNLFNKRDTRIDSSMRKYALYTPGRMLVVGLKVRLKQ